MKLHPLYLSAALILNGAPIAHATPLPPEDERLTLSALFKPISHNKTRFGVSSLHYTFSGTTADTINYIQLCYATNNTCSSCNVPFTTITSGTPIPYSTGGTTYGVSPASIAAYLSTNGFSGTGSPTYNIGMYVKSTHLNCASSTAYCSTNKASTPTHLLCMQATYNGTNVTALARTDSGNAILQTSTNQYSYVPDGNGNMYQCTLNTNGTFNTCTITPALGAPSWAAPVAMAFTTVSGTQLAYVADYNGNNIYQCTLNTNGTFNTCSVTPASGAPAWLPNGVTFATVNGTQFAYVADNSNPGNMYQCTLNTNGTFNTCSVTPSSGAPSWLPALVAFATVNGTQYAYVAENNGNMYQCSLNTNGTFNTCSTTPASGAPSWNPNGVAFATVNGTQFAYVADIGGNPGRMYQCTLNTDGTFNTCSVTPASSAPSWVPLEVAFTTVNGAQFAYIADDSSTPARMYQCTLNTDGTFNTCSVTPASGAPSWAPGQVASAYITP